MSDQSNQPNWRKAPDGATHWAPDSKSYSECWYKKVGAYWWFAKAWCDSKEWYRMNTPPTIFRKGKMVKRPAP